MTPSPAREVLYIDRENGKNLIAYRKKLLRISGVPDLRYWGRWVSLPFLGVASKELLQYAEEVKPLLIFDSPCACPPTSTRTPTAKWRGS